MKTCRQKELEDYQIKKNNKSKDKSKSYAKIVSALVLIILILLIILKSYTIFSKLNVD